MEEVEAELQAEALGHGSRQARLLTRVQRLKEEQEAEAVRQLALEAVLAKVGVPCAQLAHSLPPIGSHCLTQLPHTTVRYGSTDRKDWPSDIR